MSLIFCSCSFHWIYNNFKFKNITNVCLGLVILTSKVTEAVIVETSLRVSKAPTEGCQQLDKKEKTLAPIGLKT